MSSRYQCFHCNATVEAGELHRVGIECGDVVERFLSSAWTQLAPGRDKTLPFPRGFWPDVARLAVYLALDEPVPADLRLTKCDRGNSPEPARSAPKVSGKKLAAARAANTAALLALLKKEK